MILGRTKLKNLPQSGQTFDRPYSCLNYLLFSYLLLSRLFKDSYWILNYIEIFNIEIADTRRKIKYINHDFIKNTLTLKSLELSLAQEKICDFQQNSPSHAKKGKFIPFFAWKLEMSPFWLKIFILLAMFLLFYISTIMHCHIQIYAE